MVLKVQNFRGIKYAEIEGIPKETPWIFLTGKNGFGKTSLLQSLYIGLKGNRDGHTILSTEDFEIAVDYYRLSNVPEITQLKKMTGIVIIDELDLHLHPDWQYKLSGLLSSVFPRVQFIASTHSPIPLLGTPNGSILLNVDRTKEEGITVKKLDVE